MIAAILDRFVMGVIHITPSGYYDQTKSQDGSHLEYGYVQ